MLEKFFKSKKDKAVICDLDGTLCDVSHRLHLVRQMPPNFEAFNDLCSIDPVVEPVKKLLRSLHKDGYKIIFVSGRCGSTYDKTMQWLKKNYGTDFFALFMRGIDNSDSDDIVKEEIYDKIVEYLDLDVEFVIDDRKKVKRMWVRKGLFVFDVNQHDVEF